MPFVPPLAAGALLALAGAPAASVCVPPQPADISVSPSTAELVIDTSRPLDEMLRPEDTDTINPYGYEAVTQIHGFMSGRIGLRHLTKLGHRIDKKTGGVCLWYEKVEIGIEIEPEIVIASEIADHRCMYEATLEHEMKHVMVDRQIANKYAQTIGRKIYDGLAARGFYVGPIAREHAQDAASRMQRTVGQLLDLEYKKMEVERREIQQGIDSLEEYNRVSALCPDYRSPNEEKERRRRR